MGQKVNPVGLRLGINRGWDSVWYESFYSYVFTGGGSKIKNFYNYFRTKHGYDIQFLEPPKSCGIPKVLNDASIMSLYSSFWLLTNKSSKSDDFIQKIDSFSSKVWYKRFVDLL